MEQLTVLETEQAVTIEQLLRIINININVYNANVHHSQEMLILCFRTAFSEADRKAVSPAYIGLRPCGPQVEERAMARMYKMARLFIVHIKNFLPP